MAEFYESSLGVESASLGLNRKWKETPGAGEVAGQGQVMNLRGRGGVPAGNLGDARTHGEHNPH
jgi:hypothetical protein